MSMNLGTAACEAARAMRENPHWTALRAGLLNVARQRVHAALDMEPSRQADAVGYARAMRDLVVAFDAATTGENPVLVQKATTIEQKAK